MADKKGGDNSVVNPIIIGVLIAVIPATLGYMLSSFDSLRRQRLEFTNDQIEKLYGPLYALTQASDAAWNEFQASNWPSNQETRRYFFDHHPPPTMEETAQWRHWMQTVFKPLNLRAEQVIVENSQLIVGNELPDAFQRLIAQTEAYKAVISSWSDADKENPEKYKASKCNTVAGINYPNEIIKCVSNTYVKLKDQQASLQNVWSGYLASDPTPDPVCVERKSQPKSLRSSDRHDADNNPDAPTIDVRRQDCL